MDAASSEASTRIGPGRIVLIVGPSGAGKDTLIRIVRERLANDATGNLRVDFPKRFVTRPASAAEDNVELNDETFEEQAAQGAFALMWHAHGFSYGLSKSIDEACAAGRTVVLNVSRAVIAMARARYVDSSIVYIDAAPEIRAQRLLSRGRESTAEVLDRLAKAPGAITPNDADLVITNDGRPEIGAEALYRHIVAPMGASAG
jgi:ribose 1,5-bisphosphokinase